MKCLIYNRKLNTRFKDSYMLRAEIEIEQRSYKEENSIYKIIRCNKRSYRIHIKKIIYRIW